MFTYPALLWGLPVAGIVVLIHIINMLRHKRVQWGAIEFLLAGYKKSRTRMLLQQLLLLLMRVAAVVLIVLMLAGPKLQGRFAEMFGSRKPTLHLVLLDDSFSMSDKSTGQSAFDDALGVVQKIVENATSGGRKTNVTDRLTLVRFSQARTVAHGEPADFAEIVLDGKGTNFVHERLGALTVSESSAGPEDALSAVLARAAEFSASYKTVVYLVSDFRNKDWTRTEPVQKQLAELNNNGINTRFVRTVDAEHPNLAIRQVKVVPGIHAADIPVLLEVTVANFGNKLVENVHSSITVDQRTQPGQNIPSIAPGKETTLRFPIRLTGGGLHKVQLQLETDAVSCDNKFFISLDIPQEINVLVISDEKKPGAMSLNSGSGTDSSMLGLGNESVSTESGSMYLRSALSPEGVRTGIRVQTEPPSFLSVNPLERFDVVVVLDNENLEPSAIRTLESFAKRGGGVAFFVGPKTDSPFVNEKLYRNGAGIFPAKLKTVESLLPDYLIKQPDLSVVNHPMFRIFEQGGSALLGAVRFEKYFSADLPISGSSNQENGKSSEKETEANAATESEKITDEKASHTQNIQVLGRLRNDAPLILESQYGKGRVITFLTTAEPSWNNWGRGNPSFVITMLELVAYLSEKQSSLLPLQVGSPIIFEFDPARYENMVKIISPVPQVENSSDPGYDAPMYAVDENSSGKTTTLEARTDASGMNSIQFDATDLSGFYDVVLLQRGVAGETTSEIRTFAVNVDFSEGNLAVVEKGSLSESLGQLGVSIEEANQFSAPYELLTASSLGEGLLFIVLALLCLEMLLAGRILGSK
ncbi:MAG: BatA domain-containing protein [Thermoguttaceae bacterium]